MTVPLIQALVDVHGFASVDLETVDGFLNAHPNAILFFAGDAVRRVESLDVAVVLPELMKVFGEVLTPALVAPEAERGLQLRYRFTGFPTLVILERDRYLGAVAGVLDWGDYLRDIAEILQRSPSEPPAYRFPDGCLSAGMQTQ